MARVVDGPKSLAARSATAVIKYHDKWMRPIYNFAEQRHVASLLAPQHFVLPPAGDDSDDEEGPADSFRLADVLAESPEALPAICGVADAQPPAGSSATADKPWGWAAPPPAAAAAAIDDDLPNNLTGHVQLKQRLILQWRDLSRYHNVAGDRREIRPSDKEQPAAYWLRKRQDWPDLSELMLYWLAAPVSTAGVERGFSFQTIIDSNTRRGRRSLEADPAGPGQHDGVLV